MNEVSAKQVQPEVVNKQAMTPEEEIASKKEEIKKLEKKVSEENKAKKEEDKKKREARDTFLKTQDGVVSEILKKSYAYRKLGKKAKWESNIMTEIKRLIGEFGKKTN